MLKLLLPSIGFVLILWGAAGAAIPLITDDTGTQGKGKFQVELFGEYRHDSAGALTTKTADFSATLTYGIVDTVDLILGIPYEAWRSEHAESVMKGSGIGDLSLEAKWRLYEKKGFSVALKPGFTIPSGNEDKGLGTGRLTYHLFFIATEQMKPLEFDMNVGYLYNENSIGQRKDIWSASFDGQVEVVRRLKLAFDIGAATNTHSSSKTPPAYVLGGIIYSLGENVDVGLGVMGGITKPAPEITVRGGITWRF